MRKLAVALSFCIMIMFILTAFAMGFDNKNDPNLILWLDFDDKETKDLSPKKTAFTAFVPGTIVEGLVEGAWQFEEGTEIGVGQAFSDPFTESTFSVWVLKSSDSGVIYEEGGGTIRRHRIEAASDGRILSRRPRMCSSVQAGARV